MTIQEAIEYIDQHLPSEIELRISELRKVLKVLISTQAIPLNPISGGQLYKRPGNLQQDVIELGDIFIGWRNFTLWWDRAIFIGEDPNNDSHWYVYASQEIPENLEELTA